MDYLATIDSPVGSVTVASDGEAIVGLWLEGQKHFEATLEAAEDHPDLPVLVEARAWLERYFAGDDPGALPPVNPRGTAFQPTASAVMSSTLQESSSTVSPRLSASPSMARTQFAASKSFLPMP